MHPLLLSIFFGVAGILSIFPLIILKFRTKNIIQNEPKFNHIKNDNTKGKWNYIILSGISISSEVAIFTYTLKVKTNLYIWNILSTSFFL